MLWTTGAGGLTPRDAARRLLWSGCAAVGHWECGRVRITMQVVRTGGAGLPWLFLTAGVQTNHMLAWKQGCGWGASPMGRGVLRLVSGINGRYRWPCGIVWNWARASWRH